MYRTILTIATFCLFGFVWSQTDGFKISQPTGFTPEKSSNQSVLYSVSLDENGSIYSPSMYLLKLKGSRWQIGYDYGVLLGQAMTENYHTLLTSVIPEEWEIITLELFLDWQWNYYLSVELPSEFKEELNGISEGGKSIGIDNLHVLLGRTLAIANLPGDIEANIEYLIESEILLSSEMKSTIKTLLAAGTFKKLKVQQCSYFAVWGSRTQNNQLFSMRNLDWAPDTGISKYKLVTVYDIDGTSHSYVTLGFAGFVGAIAGMSEGGLTVHEAASDVKQETFLGFAWTLRLRYIMENVNTLSGARKIWENTNNTMGMNHMISSANDAKPSGSHPAYALETMAHYTAYFQDNDIRESQLIYTDPQTGVKTPLGAPMEEAVWRSNHGYDPQIVAQQLRETTPTSDTEVRYMLMHDGFQYYEDANIKMDFNDAINITSLVGAKGGSTRESFLTCSNAKKGTNILSITFAPKEKAGTMWVAWESGTKDTWQPACCGSYVQFDMEKWW